MQKAFRVCVDVDPANPIARRFYERYGARDLKPHWMVWEDISVVLGQARFAKGWQTDPRRDR